MSPSWVLCPLQKSAPVIASLTQGLPFPLLPMQTV
ncbi:uncharacterized protein METZ01_LOCUS395312, partial [marine metagenome]